MKEPAIEGIEKIVRVIAQTAIENEHYFSELDGVVADGDFGSSLSKGFTAIMEQWDSIDRSSGEKFLVGCAKIISNNIGGVSGSIWRAAFRQAGKSINDKKELGPEDAVAALRASAEGIMDRGGAELGDKTLLDALVPAVDAFEEKVQSGKSVKEALDHAAQVARTQSEVTKAWIAKRGRASYTGERSMDTYDPGAVAIATMAENLARDWPGD